MSRTGSNKHRVAIVGTGHRGTGMWGKELLAGWSEEIEMVGLCDVNPLRLARARDAMGVQAKDAALFTDFDAMIREARPQRIIVCTPDNTHDDFIVRRWRRASTSSRKSPSPRRLPRRAASSTCRRVPEGAWT